MLADIGYLSFYNGSIGLRHPRLYSLQTALSDAVFATKGANIPLYSAWWTNATDWHGGCWNPTTNKEDCNSVCRDPGRFFTDATTIHNCAVFWRLQELNISSSTSNTTLQEFELANEMALFTNTTITGYTDGFIFGPKDSRYQYFDGLSPIGYCLQRACIANTGQSCDDLRMTLVPGSAATSAYYQLCPSSFGISDDGLNGDVGGIGVYSSYWGQIVICVLAILVHLILILPCFIATDKKAGLITALVDFHKAQCFFSLAISIAVFLIVNKGTVGAWTMQSLWNTYQMMRTAALCGVVPVVTTLYQLDLAGQLDGQWYMIILSIVTFLAASFASNWRFNVGAGYDNLNSLSPYKMVWCSDTNPAMYCLDDTKAQYTGMGANIWNIVLVVVCGSIFIGILVRHGMQQKIAELLSKNSWISRYLIAGKSLISIFLLLCLIRYGLSLGIIGRKVNEKDWGFGQIVALTLWVPILIEIAPVLGVDYKKWSNYRLAKPYQVSSGTVPSPGQTTPNTAPAPVASGSATGFSGQPSGRVSQPVSRTNTLVTPSQRISAGLNPV